MKTGYVVYIDEAGDVGLKTVRPADPSGASEWFILGAVVVRAENSLKAVEWIRHIKSGIRGAQRPDLHFYTLSHTQKLLACQKIANWPLRCFAVVSNKKNMRGYHNPRASQVRSNNPFYNWMLRLLLERITNFCAGRTLKDYGEVRKLRIEMAETGGFSIAQTQAYLTKIKMQSAAGRLFLSKGDLAWEMIDVYELAIFPAARRAGIQLADAVASAFRSAVELNENGTNTPDYAIQLVPRPAPYGRLGSKNPRSNSSKNSVTTEDT